MKKLFTVLSILLAPQISWGADSIPVSRINVSNEAEDKVVEILVPDAVNRLATDTYISGGVLGTLPGGITDLIIENLKNGGSPDMIVDGSSVVKVFSVLADSSGGGAKSKFITSIRQYLTCTNIKFAQFFCKNTVLTNCVLVEIVSGGATVTLPLLCKTEDWKNKFAINSPEDFRIDMQAGADQVIADFRFINPIELTPNSGDKIEISIRDNITGSTGGNISEYGSLAIGFSK